jgi:hypothetical protein
MKWVDVLKQEDIHNFLRSVKEAYEEHEGKTSMGLRLDIMVAGKSKGIRNDTIALVVRSMSTDKPILDIPTLNQAIRSDNARRARKPKPPRRKGQRKNRRR